MNWIKRLFGIKDKPKKEDVKRNSLISEADYVRADLYRFVRGREKLLSMPTRKDKSEPRPEPSKSNEDYTPPIFETYTPPVDYSASNYTSRTIDSPSNDTSFGGFGGGDFSGGGSSGDF